MRRQANKSALKRTYAAHHFGRLIPIAGSWEIPNHLTSMNTETLDIIREMAWDDWNFGSGDPKVLVLYKQIDEFVKVRTKNR